MKSLGNKAYTRYLSFPKQKYQILANCKYLPKFTHPRCLSSFFFSFQIKMEILYNLQPFHTTGGTRPAVRSFYYCGETSNTLNSPYVAVLHRKTTKSQAYIHRGRTPLGYRSQKLTCACMKSSVHAHGTKFRGGNFKHKLWQFATDSQVCRHEAVIEEQGRFTKRSLPWGIRPVSVNGGIGTNFPRHYFKTKISLAGRREAEFSVS